MAASRKILVAFVLLLGACATTGRDQRVGSNRLTAVPIDMPVVLADVTRADGVRLLAGLAGSPSHDVLVLAGLSRDRNGGWLVSMMSRSPHTYGDAGCGATIAPTLVPGGESIVAECRSGGTNGIGYVSVLGVARSEPSNVDEPKKLIEFSCSVTGVTIDGANRRTTGRDGSS
jgi:hypothetical protein